MLLLIHTTETFFLMINLRWACLTLVETTQPVTTKKENNAQVTCHSAIL